jgi:hypothetical protein
MHTLVHELAEQLGLPASMGCGCGSVFFGMSLSISGQLGVALSRRSFKSERLSALGALF